MQTPNFPNLRACGFGCEVDGLQVPQLIEPKPVGVGQCEHDRVAVGRLPTLLAGGLDEFDLVVGAVEELLELFFAEGALGRPAFEFLHVRCGVPLVVDLGRMGTKALFADPVPAIIGVGDIGREVTQCGLVGAQSRVTQVSDQAQSPEILLDMGRRPMPRKFIHMIHEPADVPDALVNRVELEVSRELLVAPAIKHLIERRLVWGKTPERCGTRGPRTPGAELRGRAPK